jgi:hypothetical protein
MARATAHVRSFWKFFHFVNQFPRPAHKNGHPVLSSRFLSRVLVITISSHLNTVLEVEDMGFMVGKSSAKPSLKLHLLRFGMQPLYQDVKICDLVLPKRARTRSKLFIHCNYSILFNDLLYW